MSVKPPKAEVETHEADVRFTPERASVAVVEIDAGICSDFTLRLATVMLMTEARDTAYVRLAPNSGQKSRETEIG